MTVEILACGCEVVAGDDILASQSWCPSHTPAFRTGLWACWECGWVSARFDRLERHVYGDHIGAQVA
ncbi:MAG: hypothetical protein ACRDKW_09855 [Actinomycetota bacterium]